MPPFAEWKDGRLRLHVRLTPKAQADRIDGVGEMQAGEGPAALLVRVRALPSEGAANAALISVLAKASGLPKSALALAAGGKSRVKTVVAEGSADRLAAALRRLEEIAGAGR